MESERESEGARGERAGERERERGRGERGRMSAKRSAKVITSPANLIFRFLQNRALVQVWLYEQANVRIEGTIIGFDEFMNVVLDNAEELDLKSKTRKQLGRILLKGDTITLLMGVQKGS